MRSSTAFVILSVLASASAAPIESQQQDKRWCIWGWGTTCGRVSTPSVAASSVKASSTAVVAPVASKASSAVVQSSAITAASAVKVSAAAPSASAYAAVNVKWDACKGFDWSTWSTGWSWSGYNIHYVKAWYLDNYGTNPPPGYTWQQVSSLVSAHGKKTVAVLPKSTYKAGGGCANPWSKPTAVVSVAASSVKVTPAASSAAASVKVSVAAPAPSAPAASASGSKASVAGPAPSAAAPSAAAPSAAAPSAAAPSAAAPSAAAPSAAAPSAAAPSAAAPSAAAPSAAAPSAAAPSAAAPAPSAAAPSAAAPAPSAAAPSAADNASAAAPAASASASGSDSTGSTGTGSNTGSTGSNTGSTGTNAGDNSGSNTGSTGTSTGSNTGSGAPGSGSGDNSGSASASASASASSSAATPAAITLNTGYSSVGCFQEVEGRLLARVQTSDPNQTLEKCTALCAANGFQVAGLEYGSECYCGDADDLEDALVSGECKMACSGDSTEICGGPNAINAFINPAVVAKTVVLPAGWSNYGNVAEGSSGRTLTYFAYSDSSNTNVKCANTCQGLGYTVSGTEYTSECFCGNGFSNGGGAFASTPTMPCGGDSAQVCGGPNLLTISTSLSSIPTL